MDDSSFKILHYCLDLVLDTLGLFPDDTYHMLSCMDHLISEGNNLLSLVDESFECSRFLLKCFIFLFLGCDILFVLSFASRGVGGLLFSCEDPIHQMVDQL